MYRDKKDKVQLSTPAHQRPGETFFHPAVQRMPDTANHIGPQTESYVGALPGKGQKLSAGERAFFEPRFGQDFSNVQLHTDTTANASAKDLGARAYTHGNDIVFASRQYQPDTESGNRLLAHELTHVVQQRSVQRKAIQRCPDPATDAKFDATATAMKATAEYGKLSPADKAVADKLVTDTKPKPNCIYYIDKLKLMMDTPLGTPAAATAVYTGATATAVTAEAKRVADPGEKLRLGLEEAAVKSAGRVYTTKAGKYGGGKFEIDGRDPNNIYVKIKILLEKRGTGTDPYVDSIKGMEDAIEKAASAMGYIVDIDFVTPAQAAADPNTFKIGVDPSQPEVATNWAGGGPTGYAHELHHILQFELDRYNYIDAHSDNSIMAIPTRLYWFGKELTKTPGYNNPQSIMASGSSPLDDDICNVAGLNVATCVKSREDTAKAFKEINKFVTYDEKILNCISKLQVKDPDTMMNILRELFRRMVGLPETKKKIVKRLDDAKDPLAIVFKKLKADQQTELRGILPP
ncbi:DUF4157 domain-containing protein [Chitinophaga niabensis]|uniref:eCIS core domain-containing protein n=1 Tax=Chitinophaga niabensis TaxID=536979 RepID=UPI0031BA79DD